MKITRVKISHDATVRLRGVQGKTGLTPNILLRVGFGLSLRDQSFLDPEKYPEDGQELNRYTITGEYDNGFVVLLKEWLSCNKKGNDDETMMNFFRAHLNRGAILLHMRVKSLTDLALLD